MEALRVIKKPVNSTITITLPASFGDGEVEVIVRPVGKDRKKNETFDPEKFRGSLRSEMSDKELEEEIRKMREEWERGF